MIKKISSLLLIVTAAVVSSGYDYPKTKIEQEMEEMGSITKADGIYLISSKKEKSTATSEKLGNVNKYMFQAAVFEFSIGGVETADNNTGIVMTGWYPVNDKKDTQVKLTAIIKSDTISVEGIKVMAFSRKKISGQWSEPESMPELASDLENKILRRARNIYLSKPVK